MESFYTTNDLVSFTPFKEPLKTAREELLDCCRVLLKGYPLKFSFRDES